ncbi:hypothetical protein SELMODRAFT_424333 [Selaginella moellendorffii]|uniref:Uncharacterized protein n=1 Tax=Selaginella moellendorffii TaxID=88036 RepID=D8SPJ6_SELML|nr:hypothetical protein SELMODRAFT_424333 [Selaginella moellendorffii]
MEEEHLRHPQSQKRGKKGKTGTRMKPWQGIALVQPIIFLDTPVGFSQRPQIMVLVSPSPVVLLDTNVLREAISAVDGNHDPGVVTLQIFESLRLLQQQRASPLTVKKLSAEEPAPDGSTWTRSKNAQSRGGND